MVAMAPALYSLIRKMEIIRKVDELRHRVAGAKAEGKSVGLVPTMGALHAGHISLVDRARKENDMVVVSVFVNPTQFNNAEDLATYPRTEEADCAKLEAAGADVAFIPSSIQNLIHASLTSERWRPLWRGPCAPAISMASHRL